MYTLNPDLLSHDLPGTLEGSSWMWGGLQSAGGRGVDLALSPSLPTQVCCHG